MPLHRGLHVSNREVCGRAVLSSVWQSAASSSSRTVVLPRDVFPGCHRASSRFRRTSVRTSSLALSCLQPFPAELGAALQGSEECRREDPTAQSGRGVCMSAGSLDGVANAVSRRSWSRVVAFVLVFVMVASALAIVTTPARASSRPRIGLPEAMPDYMKFIVVNSFRFDPLAAMPTMPTSLQYNSLPRNQPLYYLAQFNGPVTPLIKAQLTATGATILYYIPYNTFIVRADRLTMDRISPLASIRWTGVLEPAYKPSHRPSDDYDLLAQRALDRSLPGSSATSIATGNSMRSFSSDLA